jgi:hypothetical protein
MKHIGFAGLSRTAIGDFYAGIGFIGRGVRYEGGYGAEAYRLMARFAAHEHGVSRIIATPRDLGRKAAAEEAGFRLVEAHPPQHAKRRRGYGSWTLAWEPKP